MRRSLWYWDRVSENLLVASTRVLTLASFPAQLLDLGLHEFGDGVEIHEFHLQSIGRRRSFSLESRVLPRDADTVSVDCQALFLLMLM
jgi:hypothetical protein